MPVATEWFEFRRQDYATAVYNAGGIAVCVFSPVQEGLVQYIERALYKRTGTATLYAFVQTGETVGSPVTSSNDPIFGTLVDEASSSSTDLQRDFLSPIFVPPGSRFVVWMGPGPGGTPGTFASVFIQSAFCRIDPSSEYGSLSSRERLALHQRDWINEMERENAEVVHGSSWNLTIPEPDGGLSDGLSPWASETKTK